MSSGRDEKYISELCSGPETKELPTYTNLCGASAPIYAWPQTSQTSSTLVSSESQWEIIMPTSQGVVEN